MVRSPGFSLLELSISLMVLAVMGGAALSLATARVENNNQALTEERLNTLETALKKYFLVQKRLPCPARADIPESNTNFGYETNAPSNCNDNTTTFAVANVVAGNIAKGTVPVKALQLSDEYMYDGWGRRISYTVDVRYTENGAFDSRPVTTTGAISVNDAAGGARTSGAVVALVSHGKNGHGAYSKAGTIIADSSGVTSAAELANCDCDGTTGAWGTANTNVFVQKAANMGDQAANYFDDGVRYLMRSQMGANKLTEDQCAGSPDPGTLCEDGTIFVGISPDGNKPMYTTQCYVGIVQGDINGGCGMPQSLQFNANPTGLNPCITDEDGCIKGQENSAVYESTTNTIFRYCADLDVNGHTDWYVPSIRELDVLYQYRNHGALAASSTLNTFWSSSRDSLSMTNALVKNFNTGAQGSLLTTNSSQVFRCVRKQN